ncbi:hypothetical protein GCM10022254_48240 [Actinomadura meridiana]|uniref:DinB-like domain-containing protein n=1 Tax=Actinomadura meridiana TaxID=559626 RepID=A0ABP8CC10_9ACTN
MLRDAYQTLLDAAATVGSDRVPPPGEWNADQILAHVSIINAATIATVASVTAGAITTYDNRLSQDTWTLNNTIALAGGNKGLQDRIRHQSDALCALVGPTLSEEELNTLIPARLLSNDELLVDRPMPLRDIINGLAESELPGHTQQLQSLRRGH